MAQAYEHKKLVDQAKALAECDAIEAEIAELRASYEQYFLGLERRPPADQHRDLKKRISNLRGLFVRQTAAKFRMQSVQQKFTTYERLWTRTLQEIENGTYIRDLSRLRRKGGAPKPAEAKKPKDDFSIDEMQPEEVDSLLSGAAFQQSPAAPKGAPAVAPLVPAIPAVSPSSAPTTRPLPASAPAQRGVTVPPVSAGGRANASSPPPPGPLGDDKLRAVYDAYVKAKKRCNEDVSNLNYDQVAQSLRKQVPELMKKHGAKAVEFKVVIKDGKAVLRAVPK